MRTLEQNFLKDYIDNIDNHNQNLPTLHHFVDFIKNSDGMSLQEKCREFDYAFLGDLSRIISVIMSIAEHPHISSSREEIVARIEQVKQISNEDFTRSIHESSFWKKKGIDMIPEKVFYYQQVDELLIYENKFIRLLIDILDQELTQYFDLYTNMLPQIDSSLRLNNAGKNLVLSMKKINLLKKRINLLKNTRFYKTLARTPKIGRNVQKTNILIHDNLYKQCYMFYIKFVIYSDSFEVQNDMKRYYLTVLIKELSKKGYEFVEKANDTDWVFENNDFVVSISLENVDSGIVFNVKNKESDISQKHLLLISPSLVREDVVIPEKHDFDSIDIMTLWNLLSAYDLDTAKLVSPLNESELISAFIESKTAILTINHDVYSNVCPVCKCKVNENDVGEVICSACHTKYRYLKNSEDMFRIWFTVLRRK